MSGPPGRSSWHPRTNTRPDLPSSTTAQATYPPTPGSHAAGACSRPCSSRLPRPWRCRRVARIRAPDSERLESDWRPPPFGGDDFRSFHERAARGLSAAVGSQPDRRRPPSSESRSMSRRVVVLASSSCSEVLEAPHEPLEESLTEARRKWEPPHPHGMSKSTEPQKGTKQNIQYRTSNKI